MDNSKRIGFFTSSQMSRLASSLKNGKPSRSFSGYCEEVAIERMMNRGVGVEVKSQPLKWGSLMEVVLFNLLGIGYEMTHKMTIIHEDFKTWSGTPDLIAKGVKIGEIKSFYPSKFGKLSKCLKKQDVELFKSEFPDEYWQCVSNAILCKEKRAEIIVYMPYKKELEEIIQNIEDTSFLEQNGLDPQDYYFLTRCDIETLPYLPDDSPMSNINSFEFEVPVDDCVFLTKRVIEAEEEVLQILSE